MTGSTPAPDLQETTAKMDASAPLHRAEGTAADLPFGQALFWLPGHVPPSRGVSALPFLFWLMETLRPRLLVQNGVSDGAIYLGLCDVATRLGLAMRAVGVDRPDSRVPAEVRARHDAAYGMFSTLRDARTASLPQIAAEVGNSVGDTAAGAEVDLLILSGVFDKAGAARLAQDGLPRMSDRGVILFCDPQSLFQTAEQWQALWDRTDLAGGRQVLRLGPWVPEGPAFEMILGPAAPAALARLAGSEAGAQMLRLAFGRLGQALVDQVTRDQLRAERAAMQTAEAAAFADLGALQAQLHDRDQLAREAERTGAKVVAQELALAELRDAHAARIDDIAALTGHFEQELARAEERRKAAAAAAAQERVQLAAKLKAVTKERDQLAAKLKAMVKSLSWRVTKPLRKFRQVLRR